MYFEGAVSVVDIASMKDQSSYTQLYKHFSVCASGVDVCRVKGYNESSCGAIITSLGYPRKARTDCVMTWLL